MIDFITNVTYKLLYIHFDVHFLFRFHNRNINNFDNKNDTSY